MNKMLKPTDVMLVGFLFICFCLVLEPSLAAQNSSIDGSLNKVRDFHPNFIHHAQITPSIGVCIPQDLIPHSSPVKEDVAINSSQSEQRIKDMYALNANMQRDIVFDDAQTGDPMKKGLKNSVGISISGNGQKLSGDNAWMDSGTDDAGIENMVDNATVSKQHDGPAYYQSNTGSQDQQRLGNYMNIDVSGVDVKAINTAQGGSAVATSNIIIKPVQVINCPPEVEEKLK
jgi:hypothetical protein